MWQAFVFTVLESWCYGSVCSVIVNQLSFVSGAFRQVIEVFGDAKESQAMRQLAVIVS